MPGLEQEGYLTSPTAVELGNAPEIGQSPRSATWGFVCRLDLSGCVAPSACPITRHLGLVGGHGRQTGRSDRPRSLGPSALFVSGQVAWLCWVWGLDRVALVQPTVDGRVVQRSSGLSMLRPSPRSAPGVRG